ncbi:MAG: DNA-processing protein DprA [Phocaeicola sp.]
MNNNEAAYWVALAHMPRWTYKKKNELAIEFYYKKKISIIDFFHLDESDWRELYNLDTDDILTLKQAIIDLPNLAFLVESMYSQGYEIIPLISPDYSLTLGTNLSRNNTPTILYIKGNKELLKRDSVAIVGSRKASDIALNFTDEIACKAVAERKVVVSGFAKGVDRQALDSALKYNGESIIVLPQGIMTFTTGFKTYYREIIAGRVLIVSTFFPKSPWQKELAMARNSTIYGLAKEIYVAESDNKGGTWSGVMDGLRKNRDIYVRYPQINEKNANLELINRGAKPFGKSSEIIVSNSVCEACTPYNATDSIEDEIIKILKVEFLPSKDLLSRLKLDWTDARMKKQLRSMQSVLEFKIKNKIYFKLKDMEETSLFSE